VKREATAKIRAVEKEKRDKEKREKEEREREEAAVRAAAFAAMSPEDRAALLAPAEVVEKVVQPSPPPARPVKVHLTPAAVVLAR